MKGSLQQSVKAQRHKSNRAGGAPPARTTFSSRQETLRKCESASYPCCICWGYKNTTDPESSKSSCSSRCSARMKLLCKMLKRRERKKKQNTTLFPVLVSEFLRWKRTAHCVCRRDIKVITYSALCLSASFTLLAVFSHQALCSPTPPQCTATLCQNTKCLFADLQIGCGDEGQFGRTT